jgi:uncharacterized protein YukE
MADQMKFNVERINQLSSDAKKCSEQLRTLWGELKDKSIAVIDSSWVGKDAAAYTTKVLEKENAIISVCQALELLGDTYAKVALQIENAEQNAVNAIQNNVPAQPQQPQTPQQPAGGGGNNPPATKPPTTPEPTKSNFTPTTTLPDGRPKPGVANQRGGNGQIQASTDAGTGTPANQPVTTKPPATTYKPVTTLPNGDPKPSVNKPTSASGGGKPLAPGLRPVALEK